MSVNKVIYNGNSLIDLTEDTVTPETLAEGVTAHDKSGAVIIGTMGGITIDEGKIIPKTVSDAVISLDDVSEVPHNVEVQLSSDTVTDFSGIDVNVFGKNIFSNVATITGNALTKINNSTYSLAPTTNGAMYGICADVSGLPLEIGDVLKCSVKSISKIGSVYGWRVEHQDGTYSVFSNSLDATFTITKPFKSIRLYCDRGNANFSYEAVVFTDVVVYKEAEVTKYTASADGSVNVKSISPYMTIVTDNNGVNITATYHKSWGMQTAYDRFWDAYQNNGNVVEGFGMFAGGQWTDETYQPKYPIKVSLGTNLFRNSPITDTKVSVDLSGATGGYYFNSCTALLKIVELIVNEKTTFSTAFPGCTALEEIRFEGVIGKSIDIHWSTKLSTDSLRSVIEHLGGSASATLTLPLKFNSSEYASIIAGKPSNWTIAYL